MPSAVFTATPVGGAVSSSGSASWASVRYCWFLVARYASVSASSPVACAIALTQGGVAAVPVEVVLPGEAAAAPDRQRDHLAHQRHELAVVGLAGLVVAVALAERVQYLELDPRAGVVLPDELRSLELDRGAVGQCRSGLPVAGVVLRASASAPAGAATVTCLSAAISSRVAVTSPSWVGPPLGDVLLLGDGLIPGPQVALIGGGVQRPACRAGSAAPGRT